MRRSACARGRVVVEEIDSSSVDGDVGDQWSKSGEDLESFVMKNEMSQDGLLFIGSKLSASVLNYNRF
jgi:hypothetical protein